MTDLVQQVSDSITESCSSWSTTIIRSLESYAKRASVALTGGVVTAVGLVMIPAPTPMGCVVAAYGMSILATEFEGAQDAMENGKRKLEGGLENLVEQLRDEDDSSGDEAESNNDNKLTEDSNIGDAQEESQGKEEELVDMALEEPRNKHRYPELRNILINEPIAQGAKKVWKLHATNMRKVTFHFLNEKVLPALRNFKVPRRSGAEENECENKDNDDATTTTDIDTEGNDSSSTSDTSVSTTTDDDLLEELASLS